MLWWFNCSRTNFWNFNNIWKIFTQFFRYSFEKKNEIIRFIPKPDDLTIKSLFPDRDYCPLDDPIIIENTAGFCKIIELANKSVAHLTTTTSKTKSSEHDILPSARLAVYRLILNYLPEIEKSNIWWYTQVDNSWFGMAILII